MGILRVRMIEEMKLRNFSAATQKSYLYAVTRLAKYHKKAPDQLSKEDIRAFLVHLTKTGAEPKARRRAWGENLIDLLVKGKVNELKQPMKIEYRGYSTEVTAKPKDGFWAADIWIWTLNQKITRISDWAEVTDYSSAEETEKKESAIG